MYRRYCGFAAGCNVNHEHKGTVGVNIIKRAMNPSISLQIVVVD